MSLFKREDKYVLDSSSIIDGRVVRLFEKKFFEGKIIIPLLVKTIVKKSAIDTGDRAIQILKKNAVIEYVKNKGNGLVEGICVLQVAEQKKAKVVTASDEVCRLSKFYPQVRIIDIRDLHRMLMPIFTPDKLIEVHILKRGLHSHEGVGYIEGVKIIVEHGAKFINKTVTARVTTMLLTKTGNLVFCTLDHKNNNTSNHGKK
jgi:uncharacterized protein YacL